MTRTAFKILCACCRKALYVYRGEFEGPLLPNQFRSMAGVAPPAPGEPLLCSFCGKPWYMLNARTGGFIVLTDKGFKPREPQKATKAEHLFYPAVTPDTPPEFKGAASEFTDPNIHNVKEP